jgi:SAM-dependent methyltransferase
MQWFANETFWRTFYPFMFPPSRFERAAEDVRQLCELTSVGEGEVLDLCCGPGRFAVPLASLGFSVTGVDSSPFLLGVARKLAREAAVEVEWAEEDMREFNRPASFDLALNLFTSFGYFESHEENMRVLRNLRTSLRSGGKLVMEMLGKESLASIFSPTTCDELEDGSLLIQRHRVEDGWRRLHNEWILLDGAQPLGRWHFTHWLYSGAELCAMLREAGFASARAFGSCDGAPYDNRSRRLWAVAVVE